MQNPVVVFSIFDNWPIGFFVKTSRISSTAYAYFDHDAHAKFTIKDCKGQVFGKSITPYGTIRRFDLYK